MTPDWYGRMMECDRCAAFERRRRRNMMLLWFAFALPIWAMCMKAVLGW